MNAIILPILDIPFDPPRRIQFDDVTSMLFDAFPVIQWKSFDYIFFHKETNGFTIPHKQNQYQTSQTRFADGRTLFVLLPSTTIYHVHRRTFDMPASHCMKLLPR